MSNKKCVSRFAPSPTGMLHIGNSRTAILSWLLTRKLGGTFILRIDDTDVSRSKLEYENAIKNDLQWLGLQWDYTFKQSERTDVYNEVVKKMIEAGRLYPCYETPDEIEMKRKMQLASGKPPIYDRFALNMSNEQKNQYIAEGRKPHYRFLLDRSSNAVEWNDMIKGHMSYDPAHISDPIVIREDGTMTYMICSVIDDMGIGNDMEVTHIVRGEDHVTNTAVQIQMFEVLAKIYKDANYSIPEFGHFSLVTAKDAKISKRIGGFEVSSLRENGIHPMSIVSFFATVGSSMKIDAYHDHKALLDIFDISLYSKSPTMYLPEELDHINHKLLLDSDFKSVEPYLKALNLNISEDFWLAIRQNIVKLTDISAWYEVCYNHSYSSFTFTAEDKGYISQALQDLPQGSITVDTWGEWTKALSIATGRKGKNLFMPLRLVLTNMEHGPELKYLLPLIGREEIVFRLKQAL